jgi:hypothetical protein
MHERSVFDKLLKGMMHDINETRRFVPEEMSPKLSKASWNKVQQEIFSHPEYIDEHIASKMGEFTSKEIDILKSWRSGFLMSEFYVYKEQPGEYTLLAYGSKEYGTLLFGVRGVVLPIAKMVPYLPCLVDTVLLPFNGTITFHGMLSMAKISFEQSVKKDLKNDIERSLEKYGVITSLPFDPLTAKKASGNPNSSSKRKK